MNNINTKKIIKKGLELLDLIAIERRIEIWKPIEGYPTYSVSSYGNIRNVSTGRIKKPSIREGYCRVVLYNNEKPKHFDIHRLVATTFISNPDNKECVDHVNNNKTDNNVKNLRFATREENMQNRSLSVNNTSSVKGVSWNKCKTKWRSRIGVNGKQKHIGYYNTLEEAKEARQKKANELFGEFTNSCEKI